VVEKEIHQLYREKGDRMKKFLTLTIVALMFVVPMFAAHHAEAYGDYGTAVNDGCLDSNPWDGTCRYCHVSTRSEVTPQMTGYLTTGPCYFCPTDSACVVGPVDGDGDGYASDVDCNDLDASVNPGVLEICDDGVDNDCNGLTDAFDPACPITCTDGDGDGFSFEGGACGMIDCDDSNPDVYPGATEVCNDGIDQDCSGADRTRGKICPRPENKPKRCRDGIDNDKDGLIDCADPDCAGFRFCK